MTSPLRNRSRRTLPAALATLSAMSALLILPSTAVADDGPIGSCEVQASPNGTRNIVSIDSGSATSAHLRQSGSWVADVTSSSHFLDWADTSAAETYLIRLRKSGKVNDISCTTAPAPSCVVEGGEIRFEQGVYSTMYLRRDGAWVANVSDLSTYATDETEGFLIRLRLADGTERTDVECENVPAEPDPDPEPQPEPEPEPEPDALPPVECRYVMGDTSTDFEFDGEGALNLRGDDRWIQTVTGLETLSLPGTLDVRYALVNHLQETKRTVDCVNLTPEAPPVEAEPPVEVAASDCVISELLVPSCGVWFGAETPTFGTKGTSAQGLAEYESVAHNTPDVLHFYKRNDQVWPTSREIAMSDRPGQDQQSLLFYNWKPSTTHTWAAIADGAADDNIAVVAENLKKYPNKLWLAIYHEPEDNVVLADGSGMTPADYVAMFRHVVTELEAHGVTNAVYTWNLMGYKRWWPMFEDLYPGDDVVDWVCYDPYQSGKTTDLSLLLDKDWGTGRGTYTRLAEIAPDKPMCLAEWGVEVTLESPADFFHNSDPEAILAEFPQMKLLMYWNSKDNGNFSLNNDTDKAREMAAAYAEMAASPIFNAMLPSPVPADPR